MNKKETILNIALALFSSQGFDSTPTSLIAKKAEVSEGLIFRHFTNKEGLLNEILVEGFTKLAPYLELIANETKPKKILLLTLELPYKIISEHREFWRLQNNLRLQNATFRENFDNSAFLSPLDTQVLSAFKSLKCENPQLETELFFIFLNGLGAYILDNEDKGYPTEIIKNILSKFIK